MQSTYADGTQESKFEISTADKTSGGAVTCSFTFAVGEALTVTTNGVVRSKTKQIQDEVNVVHCKMLLMAELCSLEGRLPR